MHLPLPEQLKLHKIGNLASIVIELNSKYPAEELNNQQVIVAGWGRTTTELYPNALYSAELIIVPDVIEPETITAASPTDSDREACVGDSGGKKYITKQNCMTPWKRITSIILLFISLNIWLLCYRQCEI